MRLQAIAIVLSLAWIGVSTKVHAQLAIQQKLAQIDRTFICPEDLPSDEARNSAVKLFLEQLAAVEPNITVSELGEYRMSLLKKHECRQTLANIANSGSGAKTGGTNPTDHWVQAGRIVTNQSGITITVDMDSMVSAGPDRMRVWIKYRNDNPDSDGVQETLVYEQLDCARRLHATMSLVRYSADSRVMSNDKGSASDNEPIIPDSLLAHILPFTCAAHGIKAR